MTAPAIATDVAVLADLLALRGDYAPAWASLRVSVAPNQVWIYLDRPSHVTLWRDALHSDAEVIFEDFPAEAIHFHSCTIADSHPGWCIYLASRVERVGMPAPGAWG